MTQFAAFSDDLRVPPAAENWIALDDSPDTRFIVTVDTEEEFDWNSPFDRASRSVTLHEAMKRGQEYFERAGVRPLYLTDYPVIDDPVTGALLAQWQAEDKADVGAHCHPWVNPPHVEEVTAANSFAGNLPEEWERAKITALRDRIAQVVGEAPIAFRAGRYGVGPNTAHILCDLGFRIDMSIRSGFDYSGQRGPDFSGMPVKPYRAGPGGGLIELPLSTAFTGVLGRWSRRLQPLADGNRLAGSLLARTRLFQRIPLTPEGVSPAEAISAIDRLLADGLKILMFSFHSPTLSPGHTPYVRDEADLRDFYMWWDRIFDHLARRGVTPASLRDVLAACGG